MSKIIQATKEHLPSILQINEIIDYKNPEEFMLESILAGRISVCIVEEQVAGYSLYQNIWGNTPLLALVKILPKYQGRGFGTQLVKNLEEIIKDKGYTKYLSSTEVTNTLSQKFHQKLEFTKIGILDMPHGKEMFYIKEL